MSINNNPTQKNDTAYNAVHDTRKFEISLLWQRSNAFWLFTAGAFVSFSTTYSAHLAYSIIISNIGFFVTFCWTLANRGSKFWQKNYENLMGNIDPAHFSGANGKPGTDWFTYRFSVSKLLIICSDYMTLIWLLILIGLFLKNKISFSGAYSWSGYFTVATFLLSILVLFISKGKD